MAFTRDSITAYESQPQVSVEMPNPWAPEAAQPVQAAVIPESSPVVTPEPPVEGKSSQELADGSNTEIPAEPVTATDANPEGDNTPNTNEAAPDGATRSRAQERITELVDERNAVKEYNKYLQSKVDELLRMQATKSAPESTPAPAPQADPVADIPTLETADFDPVKLSKMQSEWMQKQVAAQVKEAVKGLETNRNQVELRQAFTQRVDSFKKSTPDFDLIMSNPALPALAPEAATVVVRSENGPAIAYHLAKNPDVATRVSKMDAMSQAVAIGRIEEQITRDAQSKEPSKVVTPAPVKVASVSKAPPPPKPVSGGTSPVQKDMAQMSMEEWVAAERGRKVKERALKQELRKSLR